jgi:two-component sensor histidine kinase
MKLPQFLRPPWPLSLLLALSIVVLAVPLLGLLAVEATSLSATKRAELHADASRTAERIAADLDQTLNGYIASLETLATTPALVKDDVETVYGQAVAALRSRKLFAFLRDAATGQQLFNTRLDFGAPLPRSGGFDQPMFETKTPYVSDVVIGDVAKKAVMGVSVPVIRGTGIRYVLSLSLDPDLIKELLDRQQLPPDWNATITDRKGIVIARTRRHGDVVGKPFTALSVGGGGTSELDGNDVEGERVLWAAAPSRVSDWKVYVSVPSSRVDAAARDALLSYVLIVAAFTCAGLAGAVGMAHVIARPLALAESAAKALGEGRAVTFKPTAVAEANAIGTALVEAAELRDQAEQQILLLMREVNHRSKNMLAVVQAIARQMPDADPETFVRRFSQRVVGLAASQDLLIESNWQGVRVADLVRSQLSPFRELIDTRIGLLGPPVRLQPPAAQAIGMALHELATNASKYGALSGADGRVDITWKIEDGEEGREFVMRWEEKGGPAVAAAPEHRGFGYTIMVAMVERSLDAKVTVEYPPSGLVWKVRAPSKCTYERPETLGGPARRGAGGGH